MYDFWEVMRRRSMPRMNEVAEINIKSNKRFLRYQKRVVNRNRLYMRLKRLGRIR